MNVLLTSVGKRNYLIDYFKDAVLPYNGKVFAVNSHENAPALYRADSYQIAPLIHTPEYIPFLLNFCKDNDVKLIVPLLDSDLPVLAKARGLFEGIGVFVLVGDLALIEMANDKYQTFRFLNQNGLKTVPTFVDLRSFQSAHKAGEINFPVMVKPRWGMGSLSIYEAKDHEELDFYFKKAKKEVLQSFLRHESEQDPGKELLIMSKIHGTEYMLDVINDLKGNHKVTVIHHKLVRTGGETEAVETVEKDDLELLGKKLSKRLRFPLIMDVDVLVNEEGMYIIEFNPRFSGGYPFSHEAGINLPKVLIEWLKGNSVDDELLKPKVGTKSMKGYAMIKAHSFKIQSPLANMAK